ncbi:MAG: hypothetical protein M1827_002152 [Pycnora praestabilis]|nr:MAG: hypothetical protein M1827_002152 [Pycnora praestabilis]
MEVIERPKSSAAPSINPTIVDDAVSQSYTSDAAPASAIPTDLEKGPSTVEITSTRTPVYSTCEDLEKGLVESSSSIISDLPEKDFALPEKRQHRYIRHARHTFLNVYRRIFSVVFIANMIGFIVLVSTDRRSPGPPLSDIATAATANILVAVLIRQDYLLNVLYHTAWLIPHSAPLRVRRMLAKIYEFGGLHSGCAVASVIWFLLFAGRLTKSFVEGTFRDPAVLAITYILLVLFLAIAIFAYPKFRIFSHNTFENVHRWAGWTSVGLFWVEIVLLANGLKGNDSLGHFLIQLPAFWFLLVVSFHLFLPWFRLRKLYVTPEFLSDHAIRLRFQKKLPAYSGLAISSSPLTEWHPFACFPDGDGKGASLVVSNAGDWTRSTIQNPKPYYWIKGIPRTGVLSMAQVFKKVVVVTTGSGIGPCLSFLVDARQPSRVLWSTPNPLETFGQAINDAVKEVDRDAMIIDTRKSKRPDMVGLTYRLYVESGAEAVFVISNPKLTRRVVYAMECRGIPAFGPIWDS